MEKEILEDIEWSRRKNTGILIVEDEEKLVCIEKALENQKYFENQVSNIRDWFVDNKDCLLDTAQKVAKDGFVESCVSDFIDEVDLEFIVTDVVDEIHRGILNVLNTFKKDAQTQTEGDKK